MVSRDGVFSRALEAGHLSLNCFNPRDYARDKHRTVDDRLRGGPGMVMMVEPLLATLWTPRHKHRSAPGGVHESARPTLRSAGRHCE